MDRGKVSNENAHFHKMNQIFETIRFPPNMIRNLELNSEYSQSFAPGDDSHFSIHLRSSSMEWRTIEWATIEHEHRIIDLLIYTSRSLSLIVEARTRTFYWF